MEGSGMRTTLMILAVCSLLLSGCGTFTNLIAGPIDISSIDGHPTPRYGFFGGVQTDIAAIQQGGPIILLAADIPFSAFADTILVPCLAIGQFVFEWSTGSLPVREGPSSAERSEATQGD